MRFTLGKMFLAVAMLALACAGMMYRGYVWAEIIFAASLLLFGVQLTIGIATKSAQRLSFAVIGLGYLCTVMWATTSRFVITNRVLGLLSPLLNDPQEIHRTYDTDYFYQYLLGNLPPLNINPPGYLTVFLIGHCVFSWIFAVLAAWFAGRMYDRRTKL